MLEQEKKRLNQNYEDDHDKIIRVLQSGYRMHDTNLRPARVHVGRHEKK